MPIKLRRLLVAVCTCTLLLAARAPPAAGWLLALACQVSATRQAATRGVAAARGSLALVLLLWWALFCVMPACVAWMQVRSPCSDVCPGLVLHGTRRAGGGKPGLEACTARCFGQRAGAVGGCPCHNGSAGSCCFSFSHPAPGLTRRLTLRSFHIRRRRRGSGQSPAPRAL